MALKEPKSKTTSKDKAEPADAAAKRSVTPKSAPAKGSSEAPKKPAASRAKPAKEKETVPAETPAETAAPAVPPEASIPAAPDGPVVTSAETSVPPVAATPAPAAVEPAGVSGNDCELVVEDNKFIHVKGKGVFHVPIRELASKIMDKDGKPLKPFRVIQDLMELNIFEKIDGVLTDIETAKKVCHKHGYELDREKRKSVEQVKEAVKIKDVEKKTELEKMIQDKVRLQTVRPPVVTFMGHVDHGKTSLMDAIRKTRVVAGEAGGITQHIGAYQVVVKSGGADHPITFLDTPGHEAFTAMRIRGANVTDIVVLVVAADDGPMPQTREAYSHAKAAGVKIIVAINKVDLPSANVNKVKGQLMEMGLVSEDLGGETGMIEVSATKGLGISDLLERMILETEMLELKASPDGPCKGTIIESQVEQGRGPTATVIVRNGTLHVGDAVYVRPYWGKVKGLFDEHGKGTRASGPSGAVKIIGLTGVPDAGMEFFVMDEKEARSRSEKDLEELRQGKLQQGKKVSLENLFESIAKGQRKSLNLILKTDVMGSSEALAGQLSKINSEKIDLNMIHNAVGPITENDILLASASEAMIFGFNVKVETRAAELAKREDVNVRLYSIIYELIQDVEEAMAGRLDPELKESVIGHAQVKQIFELSKGGNVAGCVVTDGRISRQGKARLLRRKLLIYTGALGTLRRFQDDVGEVRSGLECGLRLEGFQDYEVGDIIECYSIEKVAQKL
ncbi:MAG: translation initiation factor IF-2 [Verrucomicrobiae bacterium]|nr:translation initiation factor IF-2 [Verrucomicrobiae bacterium]